MEKVLAKLSKEDLILLGAYQYGSDPQVDYAIDKYEDIEAFLCQGMHESAEFEETVARMVELFADAE